MRVRVDIPDARLIAAAGPDLDWLKALEPSVGLLSVHHHHDGMVYDGEVDDLLGNAIIALARGELHAYRILSSPWREGR